MLDNIFDNILLIKSKKLVNIFSKFVKIQYKTKMHFLYILVQFCWYYKKSEKVRFFLLWKSFLVSKGTNYQIIQGIRGDNTILDNLQPFCLLSEHSHILAMSISYVEGGTMWTWELVLLTWFFKIAAIQNDSILWDYTPPVYFTYLKDLYPTIVENISGIRCHIY